MNYQYSGISALEADFEAGIHSKVDSTKKHGISAFTLWRHARKENWNYGRLRDAVIESLSKEVLNRLGKLTGSIIGRVFDALGRATKKDFIREGS